MRLSIISKKKFFSLFGYFLLVLPVNAEETLEFDVGFLKFSDSDKNTKYNLSYFSRPGGFYPGEYEVSVYINDRKVGQELVSFVSNTDDSVRLYPNINEETLLKWGLLPAINTDENDKKSYIITHWIPSARHEFNFDTRTLRITVPSANIAPPDWLKTPPSTWETGIPALMVNYDYSGSQFKIKDQNEIDKSSFLNLNGMFSAFGWRLYSGASRSSSTNSKPTWSVGNIYLQHDYPFWQGGQFSIGQISTNGNIVDSVPFEGIMLQSDESMINPERGAYNPIISGIANSNSVVSLYHNGKLIHQRNVPMGPFEITDILKNYSGDIDVEIKEADGTVRKYKQANSRSPMMVRKDRIQYNLATGRYFIKNMKYNDMGRNFITGSFAYGLNHTTTLEAGALLAKNYQAYSFGINQYIDAIGSFSFRAAHSDATTSDSQKNSRGGQMYQFSYSREFNTTSVNLSASYYSKNQYLSFSDVQQMDTGDYNDESLLQLNDELSSSIHQRSRIQLSLSQQLGKLGSISLSGSRDSYWNTSDTTQNWSLGYGTNYKGVSLSLSGSYSKMTGNKADKVLSLSLSKSFNDFGSSRSLSATYSAIKTDDNINNSVSLGGSIFKDSPIGYSLSHSWSNHKDSKSSSVGLSYDSIFARMNANYGHQTNSSQLSYGLNGGFIAYPYGITLSKQISFDSGAVLVSIPGVSGVKLDNGQIETDWFGNAVVSNLTPYTQNEVRVQVNSLPDDVEIQNNQITVIPRKGALIKANLNPEVGRRLMFRINYQDKPLPFGAIVSINVNGSKREGIVTDKGKVYLSGLLDQGTLTATWGDEDEPFQCQASFKLPKDNGLFIEVPVKCQ